MINEWQAAVEQVVVPANANGARVLGFTSPAAGAGVTTFSRAVATTLARSGSEVLYVDLATPLRNNAPAHARTNAPAWKEPVVDRTTRGLQVTAPANLDARFYFNNVRWLRSEFLKMVRTYSNIVVDLAPLLSDEADCVNALAAATACDSVVMICLHSTLTRQEVSRTLQVASSTGVNLIGTVINERNYTPPAEEIGAAVRRWFPNARLGHYLSDRLSDSQLLR